MDQIANLKVLKETVESNPEVDKFWEDIKSEYDEDLDELKWVAKNRTEIVLKELKEDPEDKKNNSSSVKIVVTSTLATGSAMLLNCLF